MVGTKTSSVILSLGFALVSGCTANMSVKVKNAPSASTSILNPVPDLISEKPEPELPLDPETSLPSDIPALIGPSDIEGLFLSFSSAGRFAVSLSSNPNESCPDAENFELVTDKKHFEKIISQIGAQQFLLCVATASMDKVSGQVLKIGEKKSFSVRFDATPPAITLHENISLNSPFPWLTVADESEVTVTINKLEGAGNLTLLKNGESWDIQISKSGIYSFEVTAEDAVKNKSKSSHTITWADPALLVAPALTLQSTRAAESGHGADPTLSITGVISGEDVLIYNDAACSMMITKGIVAPDGTATIEITGHGQLTRDYYARRTRTDWPFESECTAVPLVFNGYLATVPTRFELMLRSFDPAGRELLESYSSTLFSIPNAYLMSQSQGVVRVDVNDLSSRKNYTDIGLYGGSMLSSHVSAAGTTFVTTSEGLSVSYDGGRTYFARSQINGIPKGSFRNPLNVPGKGVYFFSTSTGEVYLTNDEGRSFSLVATLTDGVSPAVANSSRLTASNRILVTTNRGPFLSDVDQAVFTRKTTADGLLDNSYVSLIAISGDRITLTGSSGWVAFSSNGGESFSNYQHADFGTYNFEILGAAIFDATSQIFLEMNDDDWVADLKHYDGTTITSITSRLNFPDLEFENLLHNSKYTVVSGSKGVSISKDNAATFQFFTAASFGSTYISSVYFSGDKIYVKGNSSVWSSTDGVSFAAMTLPGTTLSSFGLISDGQLFFKIDSNQIYLQSNDGPIVNLPLSSYKNAKSFYLTSATIFNGKLYAASNDGILSPGAPGQPLEIWNTTRGLGSNNVKNLYVTTGGQKVYVATANGIAHSTDFGQTFTNRTTANGLWSNSVYEVAVTSGGTIIAPHAGGGVAYSTNAGSSYSLRYHSHGMAGPWAISVAIDTTDDRLYSVAYQATSYVGGLSISTTNGNTWTKKLVADGLVSQRCNKVDLDSAGIVYISTKDGLSISSDRGNTFRNITTANGLPSNDLRGVAKEGSKVFIATAIGLVVTHDDFLTFQLYGVADGLPTASLNDVSTDGSGNILISTSQGLYKAAAASFLP